MPSIIGKRIRQLRGKRSVKELSKAASMSEAYWRDIEAGRRRPDDSRVYLRQLCMGLGLPKAEAVPLLRDAYLEEMGLKDPQLRSLCVTAIEGKLSPEARRAIIAVLLGYRLIDEQGDV